jgi:DNA-binding NarL/FixJ family response regulator
MQVAREWLARTETRLEELDKDIQDRVKLLGAILKDEDGKSPASQEKGAPPIGTRDNVIKLTRQGWKVNEIARTLKISKSEVELIQEIGPKD